MSSSFHASRHSRPAALLGTGALALALTGVAVAPASAAHRVPGGKRVLRGHTLTSPSFTVLLSKPKSFGGRTFTYQAQLNCVDSANGNATSTFTDAPFRDDVRINGKGHFHVSYKADQGATVTTVAGRIKGRRASGTLRIIEHYSDTPGANGVLPLQANGPTTCDSGVVRWTAR